MQHSKGDVAAVHGGGTGDGGTQSKSMLLKLYVSKEKYQADPPSKLENMRRSAGYQYAGLSKRIQTSHAQQLTCMAVPCFVAVAAAVSAFSCLGQAAAFVSTSGATCHQVVGAAVPFSSSWKSSGLTAGLSSCSRSFEYCRRRGGGGVRIAKAQAQAHRNKIPLLDEEAEEDVQTTAGGGRSVVPDISDDADGGGAEMSLLDELLARGAEATKSGGATESSHTGSSEWAGFKTAPDLLEVRDRKRGGCCVPTAVEVHSSRILLYSFCFRKTAAVERRQQVHCAPNFALCA